MKYTKQESLQFIAEEDVKFIRLAFCDIFGRQKNVSIMAEQLPRAFKRGVAIDGWSVTGFDNSVHSDLILHPDPSTLSVLPWRPEQGRVVRMFCDITWPDGTPFECDTRSILAKAVEDAEKEGYRFAFGSELEFYLFKRDENGEPTKVPYDKAGYMDIAPDDRGENIRREICLTLEQMGIIPECSHHEEGPGQNEIDFHYSDPMSAADNAVTFCVTVKTVAMRNGLVSDFSAKPLKNSPGNGMHINFSVTDKNGNSVLTPAIAGVLDKISDMTLFLNPTENSYERLGKCKAPKYISWSAENRSPLIRIPAAFDEYKRAELRSPDPTANPYIAYALIIYAGLHGIKNNLTLPPAADFNLFTASAEELAKFSQLPSDLKQAKKAALDSEFIKSHLSESVIESYVNR